MLGSKHIERLASGLYRNISPGLFEIQQAAQQALTHLFRALGDSSELDYKAGRRPHLEATRNEIAGRATWFEEAHLNLPLMTHLAPFQSEMPTRQGWALSTQTPPICLLQKPGLKKLLRVELPSALPFHTPNSVGSITILLHKKHQNELGRMESNAVGEEHLTQALSVSSTQSHRPTL